ncbi:MAG: DUF1553 domain-containing protein [Planctomycetales bacterium]|nr:DUF1553 domain-containing protein [Planctomycetales bacterium]
MKNAYSLAATSCAWLIAVLAAAPVRSELTVSPAETVLDGPFAQAQLLASNGKQDVTRDVTFGSSDTRVATVDDRGRITAVADGEALITVTSDGASRLVPVQVQGSGGVVDFTRHIRPILNKASCATAACHASQYGKGGFKLSVFGFDPRADYEAIARDSRQRRVNFASPDQSLILRKPAMTMPHGGGRKLPLQSHHYQTFRQWIATGAQFTGDEVHIDSLRVEPAEQVVSIDDGPWFQQLRVVARYPDGVERDVTGLAKFDSMDDGVLSVDEDGVVQVHGKGQAAVMIRFEGQTAVSMFVSPFAREVTLDAWPDDNVVDRYAMAKFRQLGLKPSGPCDDATFIRRAFLDAIGGLPTPDEIREFLASTDPDKRVKLVDRLLGLTGDSSLDIYNDRYAAYWTLKWSDLIRNNSNSVGEQGMWAMHNWIRESFRVNKPFDAFVRELVTAKGSIYSSGPANYFRINNDSTALTESTAQLFLGVRLECAKCHHHPFESYSQADYYGLAAFFSRVGSKTSEEFGIFGRETVVMTRSTGDVSHPRTRQRMTPTPLGGSPLAEEPLDRRMPLADWLTAKDNPLFARSIVNRYLGYLMGRGLVEPIDDMRSTNPPSNAEMLDALAEQFAASGYDLKQLIRTVMTSQLYQRSSSPTKENYADSRFYSFYKVKRIPAEPLLDAVDQATGAPTKFTNLPLGTRAIELPDAEYANYFLTTFAKPRRASVCECERSPDENLAQALHTLNGDTLSTKMSAAQGRLQGLLKSKRPLPEAFDEIYLATICRPPTAEEIKFAEELVNSSPTPQQGFEDLMWALMNSKQFLFVR